MGSVIRLQEGPIAPVTLLVDTSVWSLALRRDSPKASREVDALRAALEVGEAVVTTGLILQELLQGFSGPRDRNKIIDRFGALPLISPDRQDHIDAAELRNRCRRAGVQVGTIDAILAELCIRYALTLLTTDKDFAGIAANTSLRLWRPAG
jgi:predicted nucleic acid-binding protein